MAASNKEKLNYRGYDAYRSNLAYDFNTLERRRVEEAPRQKPQIRTIRRPNVSVRPAERISPFSVLGFALTAVVLGFVLFSYVQLTALSSSVVSLQEELSTLQREHVTLTAAYERTFDLSTVENAAIAAGMSDPSASQIYYLDTTASDSASVHTVQRESAIGTLFAALGEKVRYVVNYFT